MNTGSLALMPLRMKTSFRLLSSQNYNVIEQLEKGAELHVGSNLQPPGYKTWNIII